jgi:uncharacterized integral membrane protein
MRIVFLLLKIVVFVLLLGFALKNTQSVVVRYFLGFEWQAPLVFVLLVFFALGVACGVFAMVTGLMRQRRTILRLKRELRSQTAAPAPLAATAESL